MLKVIDMPDFRSQNGQKNDNQGANSQPDNAQMENNGNQNDNRPKEKTALNYTGESKTITIPDGVEITTFARGDKGGEQKTIELKDIKVGDILRIWYSDENKTTISRVSVMPVAE
ncbi:MAG: hypothetical protein PWQ97_697 [Tepidanaerobacteraceae bacterium]|nr:hypothetical protein [Tepidanaerobacteraceae bacterium]